jgi:hypothetical protein
MNSFIHAGLNGSVPVLPEKRFLISEIRLRNSSATKATVLDANGLPTGSLTVRREGDWLVVPLPEEALYCIVE